MFDDWREGIHEWVRQQTAGLVEESRIRLHDHVAAVNSSMGFAFNLFMPFREYGAAVLEKVLATSVGFPVRVVDIEFEFHGPTDVLAECAGAEPAEDEKFTASDVAIHVGDATGRAGVILVEVKLSEGEFTACNGARSSANTRKDVCASAAKFFDDPGACYLRRTRHGPGGIADIGASSVRRLAAYEEPFPDLPASAAPSKATTSRSCETTPWRSGLCRLVRRPSQLSGSSTTRTTLM